MTRYTRRPISKTRLIARYSRLPLFAGIVIALLAVNAIWEIVRQNITRPVASWPYRFTMLDLGTTANLLAILVGILVARSQYAQTIRASIMLRVTSKDLPENSLASRPTGEEPASEHFYLFNGGPGYAVVDSIRFMIQLRGKQGSDIWLSTQEVRALFASCGFTDEVDFYIFHLSDGSAMPPVQNFRAGNYMVGMRPAVSIRLEQFDMRVRFRNNLGDLYERTFELLRHLPDTHHAQRSIEPATNEST
jgi:hypothetical protein